LLDLRSLNETIAGENGWVTQDDGRFCAMTASRCAFGR